MSQGHVPASVFETSGWSLSGESRGGKSPGAHGVRGDETVPFNEPGFVVKIAEFQQGLSEFFDVFEVLDPKQVLLECPDEAFGASIALGSADERRRAFDAQEADLSLEIIGHILAAVIVAQEQAGRDLLGEGAEAAAHALSYSSASKRVPRRAA